MGATDVVPFIPVAGIELEDCVALARRVGREIWSRYHIPVYFYEGAAQRTRAHEPRKYPQGPVRGFCERKFPRIRAGSRYRRCGPTSHGWSNSRRGAQILIAYNINLNTPDITIANRIAKAIRFSSADYGT